MIFSNSLDKGGFAGEFQPKFPTLLRRGRNTKQMESQRAQTDGDNKIQKLPVLVEEEVPDLIELDPDDFLVPRSEARRLDQIFSHHERFICCSDSHKPLICAATVLHGKSKAFHHPWIPILNKYSLEPIFSANDH